MDTVEQFLRSHADRDDTALKYEERTWTWREYLAGAARRANALRALLSPDRPAHVGVLLENTPEMVFALAAGALGGYVTVGVNLTRRGSALRADILKADCQVLLTDARQRSLVDGLDLPAKADLLRKIWSGAGREGQPLIHVLATSRPTPDLLDSWQRLGATEAIWGLPDRTADEVAAYIGRLAGRLGIRAG